MSLSSQISYAVNQAFAACGDLAGLFTIRRTTIIYDPLSGDHTESVSSFTAKGIIDKDSETFTMYTTIEADQFRIWLNSTNEPNVGDLIVMPDSTVHDIVGVKSVKPYNVPFLYELLVK
jgi:hypothetical protein